MPINVKKISPIIKIQKQSKKYTTENEQYALKSLFWSFL